MKTVKYGSRIKGRFYLILFIRLELDKILKSGNKAMDGTALYQVIAVFFLAQLFAIELSMISILVIIITSLLASIGTPAVPGAGVIVLSTILITVGIPPVGILLLISVDRILDMIRTMVNVTGDLTASCVFDKITRD